MSRDVKIPASLVKTWLWMFLESDDEELRSEAQERLFSQFTTMKDVVAYLENAA